MQAKQSPMDLFLDRLKSQSEDVRAEIVPNKKEEHKDSNPKDISPEKTIETSALKSTKYVAAKTENKDDNRKSLRSIPTKADQDEVFESHDAEFSIASIKAMLSKTGLSMLNLIKLVKKPTI